MPFKYSMVVAQEQYSCFIGNGQILYFCITFIGHQNYEIDLRKLGMTHKAQDNKFAKLKYIETINRMNLGLRRVEYFQNPT